MYPQMRGQDGTPVPPYRYQADVGSSQHLVPSQDISRHQVQDQPTLEVVQGVVDVEGDQDIVNTAEQMQLAERLFPAAPEPQEVVETDSDGWSLIDKVGAWNAFLCEYQVLEEVPAQHKRTWVRAWGTVLVRVQAADNGKELDRALMWLCFLPQALLRQAK